MADEAKVRYGRKKLDKEAYEQQESEARESTREGTRFGPRKFATEKAPPVKGKAGRTRTTEKTEETPPAREPTGSLPSIAKLKELLAKSPAQLDAALEVEMKQDRPRKGALHLFKEVEEGKGDAARGDVLTNIDAALASLGE